MKLSPWFYGPFKVLAQINEVSYHLDLPSHWKIHNAFHISLLRPFKGSLPSHPMVDEPPLLVDREEHLVPASILDHESTTTHTGKVYTCYLLTFHDHAREDACWMPGKFFHNYRDLLTSFRNTLVGQLIVLRYQALPMVHLADSPSKFISGAW